MVIVISDRVEVRIPTLILEETTTMTNATMALAELAEKGPDVDMLRQMVQFAAQRLMDMEAETLCGAGYDVKNPERLNSRNGYRDRSWETRAGTVDNLVKAMGMSGVSKSQVSRLCAELDERVGTFLNRPIEGDWPYLWIDATYVKNREAGSIVSVAVIVAVAVNTEGLKAAASKVLKATWQRCRVHFMRNALARANKTQRRMVSAAIATAFAQETAKAAHEQWRVVADQFRASMPKLSKLMDGAEHEVLSYMDFPRAHWLQIHSTNPLERLNAEIKRRTNVVGIFPNDAAITRLVGAMLLEQNDEWSLNRRYMQLEGLQSLSDTAPTRVPAFQR